jgi:hypothetical protein
MAPTLINKVEQSNDLKTVLVRPREQLPNAVTEHTVSARVAVELVHIMAVSRNGYEYAWAFVLFGAARAPWR